MYIAGFFMPVFRGDFMGLYVLINKVSTWNQWRLFGMT